jgi:diguanylate cyclase
MDQATKWMRLATSKMQLHDVAPLPHHYAVFFGYFSGVQPLKDELDKLFADNLEFTDVICEDLYCRHLEKDSAQLREVKKGIRGLINQLSEQLKDLAADMDRFDNSLAECEQGLCADPDVETLKQLVGELLTEARHARDTCQASSQIVNQLNLEIDSLRGAVEQMSEEVLVDALTSVGNRRAFDLQLNETLMAAHNTGSGFCLLLLDIDNFKAFNDEHGHLVGDMVLRYVAQMIKRGVKGRDMVARYGGEEFGVILPSTDYEGGMSVAHAIADTVANQALTVGKDKRSVGRVTLSVGVSVYKPGDGVASIIGRSDSGLYAAKARGRNIVVGEKGLI